MTPTRDGRAGDETLSPFFAQLEGELVRAGERQAHRRARRRTVLAAAITLVVAGIAALTVSSLRSDPAEADEVRVERSGERVTVSFDRDELDAKTVIEQMRAAGLDVVETPTPTGKSREGLVVSLATEEVNLLAGPDGQLVFEGPWAGKIEVLVGKAVDDESFDAFTDAFLPGEPLACDSWPGQSALELVKVAEAKDIALTIRDHDSRHLTTDELAGMVVFDAIAVAPDEVHITVERGEPEPRPATCTR